MATAATVNREGVPPHLFCFSQKSFFSVCFKKIGVCLSYVGDGETCSLKDVPLEFHDLFFFVTGQNVGTSGSHTWLITRVTWGTLNYIHSLLPHLEIPTQLESGGVRNRNF